MDDEGLKRQKFREFDLFESSRTYEVFPYSYLTLYAKWGILFPDGTGIFKTRELEMKPISNYVLPTEFMINTKNWAISTKMTGEDDKNLYTYGYYYESDISSRSYNATFNRDFKYAVDTRLNVTVYYSPEFRFLWTDYKNMEPYMQYSISPPMKRSYSRRNFPVTFKRLSNIPTGYFFISFEFATPTQTIDCSSLYTLNITEDRKDNDVNNLSYHAFTNVKDSDERFLPFVPYFIYDENDSYRKKLKIRVNGEDLRGWINKAANAINQFVPYLQWSTDPDSFDKIWDRSTRRYVYINCIHVNEDGTFSGIPAGHYDAIYFRHRDHNDINATTTLKFEDVTIY